MPRPSKISSPVRAVRKAIYSRDKGMNQGKFAKLVGVSESLINQIEYGAAEVTDDIAKKIAIATGVSMESLTKKKSPPVGFDDKHYTLNTFEKWQRHKKDEMEPNIESLKKFFTDGIECLLNAAHEKGRLLPVLAALDACLQNLITGELKMADDVCRLYKKKTKRVRDRQKYTLGQFRKLIMAGYPVFKKLLEEKRDLPDSTPVELSGSVWLHWGSIFPILPHKGVPSHARILKFEFIAKFVGEPPIAQKATEAQYAIAGKTAFAPGNKVAE